MRWKLAALLCGALCLCAGATALASEEAQDLDGAMRFYDSPLSDAHSLFYRPQL